MSFYGCDGIENVHFTKGTGVGFDYTGGTSLVSQYAGTPWYISRENQIKVTFEEGISKIGNYMFANCTGLRFDDNSVLNSFQSIGESAFLGCTGLTGKLELTKSIFVKNTFKGCTGLEEVAIEISDFQIPQDSFYGCTGIEKLRIGDGITKLGSDCFYNCIKLKELTIPISLNTCPGNYDSILFTGCESLEKVTFTKGTGIGYNYGTSVKLVGQYTGTPWYLSRNNTISIVLEGEIEKIGKNMFRDCTGLNSINYNSKVYYDSTEFKNDFIINGGQVEATAFDNSGF